MFSVLIVDDEFEIREGLCQQVPWHEYGISSVTLAEDGAEALRLAEKCRPDLIITDIKMRKVSGLDLLRQLQAIEDYHWKAILISGYNNFSFAKQALHLGAMDYILKPISMTELDQMVRKSIEIITMERMEQKKLAHINDQMLFALPKLREELLHEIVENEYDPYRETRIFHRLKTLKLGWMKEMQLQLMIVEVDNLRALTYRHGIVDEKKLVLFGIGNVVSQTLGEEEIGATSVLFKDSHERWIAIIGCSGDEATERCLSLAEKCLERINQFVKVQASIALSPPARELHQLHQMYTRCEEYLKRKALQGGNRLFMEEGEEEEGRSYEKPSIREPKAVIDLVKYGNDEEIHEALTDFEEMVQSWGSCDLRDVQQHIFTWLMEVYRASAAVGWSDRSWERDPIALWDRLEQYDTLQSLQEQVKQCLLALAGDFRKMSNASSQIVQEAERMIRSRYAENLSLQLVANAVHVTPVWLSNLYKKEKGRTFLEELTEVRICKAKEMLGQSMHKIYQISYLVGYKDPVHFSKLFKKHVGITPKEYRRMRGIVDD
ncbi:response regulator [Paenibacillus sp. GCM10012306]|uniref:response regulator n=1 Tax=Paenibacillus sp. GCM10012306 TaxID=3317342 RepID=UPI0036206F2F